MASNVGTATSIMTGTLTSSVGTMSNLVQIGDIRKKANKKSPQAI